MTDPAQNAPAPTPPAPAAASTALPPPVYLTADLPGIGGLLKQQFDDFQVEEIPAYPFDGVGTHCYLKVEKRGLSTMAAADILARALGRKNIDVGYAGLKDKQALTTQWFSVEHLDTARAQSLQKAAQCGDLPQGLRIVDISRHRNKLKRGHLAGNRFTIRVRNPEWARIGATLDEPLTRAKAILDVLTRRGTPNFFGPQRFGMRRDNHLLGLALLTHNAKAFADRFLGDPDPSVDHGDVLRARHHYVKGEFDMALQFWPGHLRDERRALSALVKGKGNPKRAVFAVNLELKKLLVSALQSFLFNKVLQRRLRRFDTLLPGDFCYKHENGASFRIGPGSDDADREQPRADAHEISPTGPLFGLRMSPPDAGTVVAQMEDEVLKESGLKVEDFRGPMGAPGGRRPMRIFPVEPVLTAAQDPHGPYLEFRFTLPSGSYATVLLGEIMKEDVAID